MEHGQFIDRLPIKNGGSFHGYVSHNQMVNYNNTIIPHHPAGTPGWAFAPNHHRWRRWRRRRGRKHGRCSLAAGKNGHPLGANTVVMIRILIVLLLLLYYSILFYYIILYYNILYYILFYYIIL